MVTLDFRQVLVLAALALVMVVIVLLALRFLFRTGRLILRIGFVLLTLLVLLFGCCMAWRTLSGG